jgi:site-specific DNA recombinase
LEATLSAVPERPVVRLPTNYKALYRRALAELDLKSGDATAAREALRGLIEKVVVQPGSARGSKRRPMQLHGDLYRMLEFAEGMAAGGERRGPNAQQPRLLRDGAVVTSLVAGTGFEPVTFRL